jgi:hypothetical protein
MTGAALMLEFLGGASVPDLARRHALPPRLVEEEIRWCFLLERQGPRWKHGGLLQLASRSSRRWPFKLSRLQRFVDIVAEHEPITAADLARRFGSSRRAAAMALAHLEDLGFVRWVWQIASRQPSGVNRRGKLWRLA